MTPTGWAKYLYLAHFAKPKCDRSVFRSFKRNTITNIVEIGLRDVSFTTSIIETALKHCPDNKISYSGIDLFEARPPEQEAFSLKDMHKRLSDKRLKVRLIPGDPMVGLSRFANTLTGTNMLIVSADVDCVAMDNAWFYVPRMLDDSAVIYVYDRDGENLRTAALSKTDAIERAESASNARRAAA